MDTRIPQHRDREVQSAIIRLTCKRCGHTWIPRIEDVVQCPKCKTARYK